jgi:hypothetical protein
LLAPLRELHALHHREGQQRALPAAVPRSEHLSLACFR